MRVKSVASTVIFLLLAVNEAYSLKCYTCLGGANSDCELKPKQGLALDCNPFRKDFSTIDNFLSSATDAIERADDDFVCIAIKGTLNSTKVTERKCWIRHAGCEELKNNLRKNATLDACVTCDIDLCNSSSTMNAGICGLAVYVIVTAFTYRSTIFL